jgi:excinuclease ABC subunit A
MPSDDELEEARVVFAALADRARLKVLHALVDAGNSVLVIEHNLDVIKTADYLLDLGPEGGEAGGELVAAGTPEEVSRVSRSYTGQCLKPLLLLRKEAVHASA